MLRVIGLGDNVVDQYLHTNTMYPGGNALNIAVFAGMLGCFSAYLGVFGSDEAAAHVEQTARGLGLDLSHCRYAQGENGTSRVNLADEERVFAGSNKGGVSRTTPLALTPLDYRYLKTFDLVHTSCYSYADRYLPLMAQAGLRVSYDFSDEYTPDALSRVCPHLFCTCLSCAGMPKGEIIGLVEQIASMGCPLVIATRGKQGALVSVEGRIYEQAPCLVDAVDTLGAGDAFIARFLTAYLEGLPDARDFPAEPGAPGIITAAGYRDSLVRLSLFRAAVFSASVCMQHGAFGYGTEIAPA